MSAPEPYPLEGYERERFTMSGRAKVNVQWKGIPICADIECDCGATSHLDDTYFGFWICHQCGRAFQLAWTATAFEVEPVDAMPETQPEDY